VDDHNPTGLPQVLDEIVSGSVTRTYAYGLNRISENQLVGSTWTPSFYGDDGHENVRFLANTSSSVTDSYDYDAFGMPIRTSGTTPNNFLYSLVPRPFAFCCERVGITNHEAYAEAPHPSPQGFPNWRFESVLSVQF